MAHFTAINRRLERTAMTLALILPAVFASALASGSTVRPEPASAAAPLVLPLAFEPNLGQRMVMFGCQYTWSNINPNLDHFPAGYTEIVFL